MRQAAHPGPASGKAIDVHPCGGQVVSLTLRADLPLDEAIAIAMQGAGLTGAWIEFDNAAVDHLAYVLPSDQPTEKTIVWYSERHNLPMPGMIERIGITVGKSGGQSFLHGHGLWRSAGGPVLMGHILAEDTVLSKDIVAQAIATHSAWFERRPDAETGFSIFQPSSVGGMTEADTALLRILPNTDFSHGLAQACASLGWQRAKVHGLGSLIGAQFEDGRHLESFATEFLVLDAETTPILGEVPGAKIAIVGVDGDIVKSGRLRDLDNPVLVTVELVLTKLA